MSIEFLFAVCIVTLLILMVMIGKIALLMVDYQQCADTHQSLDKKMTALEEMDTK